jgi:transcriptional regulator with GAF, ATPase, and Fis domain
VRAKHWLIAAGLFVAFGFVNFLANYGFAVFPTGSLGNVAFVLVIAYAAVRHRLMDIDALFMRAAGTVLASVMVVLPIGGAIIWANELPPGPSGTLVGACLLLAAVLSLLGFSGSRAYVEERVERSLFPARHAARDAIRRVGIDLVRLPQQPALRRQLADALMHGLQLTGVALYERASDNGALRRTDLIGDLGAPEILEHGTPPTRSDDGDGPAVVVAPFNDAPTRHDEPRWEAFVRLRADNRTLGLIALGAKRSGAAIDEFDVTLLTLVGAQLAIGLQNVGYVRQIEQQKTAIEDLQKRVAAENVILREEVRVHSRFREIIGSSPALRDTLALVDKVGPTTVSVLICGETGTGKELVARALHDLSPLRDGPLICVNCAAIPRTLAESELFGHERGAFTGAATAQAGKFELADGGTIFLDEVGELDLDVQVKLLRVLQEREVQRLGSQRVRKLTLRVLAATNRNLLDEIGAGRFREDLYYRLATVPLYMPALRERPDDIPALATFFAERAAGTHQKAIRGFSVEAMNTLQRYHWPGNVRELQNVIERAVLLCARDAIKVDHLSGLGEPRPSASTPTSLSARLREEKFRQVSHALVQANGNQAAAARLLGMSRSNFARLMKSLGLKPPTVPSAVS